MRDLKIDIMNDQEETWICRKKRLEALASRSRRFIGEKQQMEVRDHGVKREAHDREVKRSMTPQIHQSIEKNDADVFIGTLEKVSLLENLSLSDSLWQVTPSEGSLLHVAARYGSGDIIQLLVHFLPKLIFRKNNQDETPLHEAARAVQLNATKMLIRFAKDNGGKDHGDSFVNKKNLKLNTALHLAVIRG